MMHRRKLNLLVVVVCLLLLVLSSPNIGKEVDTDRAQAEVIGIDVPTTHQIASEFAEPARTDATLSCLPHYGEPEFLLQVNATGPQNYEPSVHSADFDGDGLEDIIITKMTFQTKLMYKLDILLNDGKGGMTLATSDIFSGPVPAVQNPRQVILADFNGDGVSDIFVADHGYDADPFPGYPNTLVLSAPHGKLVDATGNLPQQNNYTHSACAADIDKDKDIDLYIGNIWGQNDIDPQILLNDGNGDFSVGVNRLPPLIDLNQNGYTTCQFADVNDDGSPDLILGDAGDDISNEYSTPDSEVLLNDGSEVFTVLPGAMPPKSVSSYDIAHDIEPIHLNADGYIDLLIVYEGWEGPGEGWRGSYIQALVNNKDGTFRDETASRLEPLDRQVWIPWLETRDLDQDGDLDLLAFPWSDQDPDPILFRNDGSGHFSLQPLDFGMPSLYYTFIDLDGDGGNDLLYDTYAPPEDIYAIHDLGCPVFLPLVCRR